MDGDCQVFTRYNLYYWSLFFCWLIVGLEGELPPGGVRDYFSLIYALNVRLFHISWSCMYFKFNHMLSNCLFPATPMF